MALCCSLVFAASATAVTYAYPGRGVGQARLGQTYSYAASKLSRPSKTVRDRSYSYTVYHTYVGTKMSNGRYPVEFYSKSTKRVFRIQVNGGGYPTTRGIKVGSKEGFLRSSYASLSGPYTSGTYTRYRLKHAIYSYATYTDFYCRNGVVKFIIVSR